MTKKLNISKGSVRQTVKEWTIITLGVLLYSFAWVSIILPADGMGGGATGIAMLVYYATGGIDGGVPIGISYFVVNAILITAAVFIIGAKFGIKTIYSIILMSIAMSVMQAVIPNNILGLANDKLLSALLGGGVAGAAYATVTAQMLIAVAGLAYFFTRKTALRFDLQMFKLKPKYLKNIVVSGFPSLGNQLSIIAMLFFHNYQALKYGRVDGLAAYTFIGAVESLGSLLMTGLALGVQPLVAYLYGGRHRRQNIIGNMGYYTAFGLGIVLMCVSVVGHDVFPAWFNLHGNAAVLAAHGLVISSTAFVLLGVIRVAGYYYQATGKITDSSLLIYGDAFVALPLCLFALPLWFGLDGVWLAMPVSRVLLFLFVCYLWFGRKKRRPYKMQHFSARR